MVSCDMLYNIHQRLCTIFHSRDNFGGKTVLLVGDIMQLKPPTGRFIFEEPSVKNTKYDLKQKIDPLWQSFEVVILETNHRQGEGYFWTKMLNNFRLGILDGISDGEKDADRLEKRRITNFPDFDPDSALHVYYKNVDVNAENHKRLNKLKTPLIEIEAEIRGYPKGRSPRYTEWGTIENTQMYKILKIKVGALVMITFNIDTSDALCNGTLGKITRIIFDQNKTVKAVIVELQNEEAGHEYKRANQWFLDKHGIKSGIPIFKDTFEFQLSSKGKNSHNSKARKAQIIQFFLKLAWASTGHKFQGRGVPKEDQLVCHGSKGFPAAMGYIMLSRCASIESVFLAEDFDINKIRPEPKALKEYDNLMQRNIVPLFVEDNYDLFYVNVDGKSSTWLKDLESDINAKKSNIVAVVETWINPSIDYDMSSPLGEFYGSSYGNGKGCGAFLPSNNFKIKSVVEEKFQILSVENNQNIQIMIVYLSDGCNYEDAKNAIDAYKTNSTCYIIGDFNFEDGDKNALTKYFNSKGLEQLINVPTHEKGRTIDHLYITKESKERIAVKVTYPYYSDHAAICVKFCSQ